MPAQVQLAPRVARADAHAPSAALIADAGPFARAVARVWARPHAAYFAFEPPRRRLAGLAAERAHGDLGALAEALETWSLKRIAAVYLPDAPAGFVEALRKIEDGGWSVQEFDLLIGFLGESESMKTLRHAPRIDRVFVRTLAALPAALRRPRIVALVDASPATAQLIERGVARACGGAAAHETVRLADRLERARTLRQLFRMLIDAIGIERLAPPPIPGADWFKPLATAAQLESAALRFENCLKYRVPMMLRALGAYYEVVGEEPAIVEVVRDGDGLWVVGEVRGHANRDISLKLWTRVRDHLARHGARVRGARADSLAVALAHAAGW